MHFICFDDHGVQSRSFDYLVGEVDIPNKFNMLGCNFEIIRLRCGVRFNRYVGRHGGSMQCRFSGSYDRVADPHPRGKA